MGVRDKMETQLNYGNWIQKKPAYLGINQPGFGGSSDPPSGFTVSHPNGIAVRDRPH